MSATLHIDARATPLGEMVLIFDPDARLFALDWVDHEPRMRRLLARRWRRSGWEPAVTARRAPAGLTDPLDAYFDGEFGALTGLATSTGGTRFQERVWSALRLIPAGETSTYGRLAAALGAPRAVRAVGAANGANPVGIVVPCHRVVGAAGGLTGYGGGLDRKAWLLRHEGARL